MVRKGKGRRDLLQLEKLGRLPDIEVASELSPEKSVGFEEVKKTEAFWVKGPTRAKQEEEYLGNGESPNEAATGDREGIAWRSCNWIGGPIPHKEPQTP